MSWNLYHKKFINYTKKEITGKYIGNIYVIYMLYICYIYKSTIQME